MSEPLLGFLLEGISKQLSVNTYVAERSQKWTFLILFNICKCNWQTFKHLRYMNGESGASDLSSRCLKQEHVHCLFDIWRTHFVWIPDLLLVDCLVEIGSVLYCQWSVPICHVLGKVPSNRFQVRLLKCDSSDHSGDVTRSVSGSVVWGDERRPRQVLCSACSVTSSSTNLELIIVESFWSSCAVANAQGSVENTQCFKHFPFFFLSVLLSVSLFSHIFSPSLRTLHQRGCVPAAVVSVACEWCVQWRQCRCICTSCVLLWLFSDLIISNF